MSEPKPFASLSPSLLARKGAARPAMRPQLQPLNFDDANGFGFGSQFRQPQFDAPYDPQDDLGWNDMGGEAASQVEEPVAPPADVVPIAGSEPAEVPVAAPQSPALKQIETLARTMAEAPAPRASRQLRSALKEGRKAAFTLRLDGERHLRLRLACTMQNRSAQHLITEALDRVLEDLAGLEELARRVKRH